jgi:hypothetical protein
MDFLNKAKDFLEENNKPQQHQQQQEQSSSQQCTFPYPAASGAMSMFRPSASSGPPHTQSIAFCTPC